MDPEFDDEVRSLLIGAGHTAYAAIGLQFCVLYRHGRGL